MEEERNKINEWIVDYLGGALDGDSLEMLKAWLAASPENRAYFRQQKEIWDASGQKQKYDKDLAFQRFQTRVAKDCTVAAKWRNYIPYVGYGVAVLLLLIVCSVFFYWEGRANYKEAMNEVVVEVPIGSRSKMFLPDGTAVWLNAGSRMVYSQDFGVDDRNVLLEGEGYFEVMKNKTLPFVVRSKDLQVRVVGTKFNFRDYPSDKEVVVTLEEGKICLNNLLRKGKETSLSPNERVCLDKKSGRMMVENVTAANALQWTHGYLFFDEELLPDIVKQLERSYNVQITIADKSLEEFRFYGNFVRQEQSIKDVLDVLSSTGNIRYTISDRDIVLYKGKLSDK